jgi:hypothetical protein
MIGLGFLKIYMILFSDAITGEFEMQVRFNRMMAQAGF